jgi:ATP-dependent DNA helicase RecG
MSDIELNTKIETIFPRLTPAQQKALSRLQLDTVRDLIYHLPTRYGHIAILKNIGEMDEGEEVSVYGKITAMRTRKAFRSRVPMAEGTIDDGTGKLKLIWFNQAYIAKMIPKGTTVQIQGKVMRNKSGLYLANPEIEKAENLPIDAGDSLFAETKDEVFGVPVYPESKGITSRWFYHAVQKVLASGILDELTDPIPEDILEKYHLPTLATALVWVHGPRKDDDAQAARKRFAFEEIFYIQLSRLKQRKDFEKQQSYAVNIDEASIEGFISRFPFTLTNSQSRAIDNIVGDMREDKPMARLLEGDVGSGKTAVAAVTSYAVVSSQKSDAKHENLQVAYMAPTEILANQLYESFIQYFSHLPIQVGLITSSGCKKFPSKVSPTEPTKISRAQLLKWTKNGEINILVGTHSLIAKSVEFKNLAYVIIDEQHRFGTNQRAKLAQKDGHAPHLLSMTATPIPRTLALTIYGDLDLTLLDEMPSGRKPIITETVPPDARDETYKRIREQLDEGRQLYVICPRIDEPDPDKAMALNVKSVTAEATRLQTKIFPEYKVDKLHSKMTPQKKDAVMQKFAEHKTDILVATSVVEVGVNVPNATVIVIEGGERFGLSQLHQLRGRVIRGTHQAYCYVFAEAKTQKTADRLKALTDAKNGFELSELDLTLRGAGELTGRKQWGVSDIGMEAIKNIKMVEAARTEAQKLIEEDPDLAKHPLIATHEALQSAIHFE